MAMVLVIEDDRTQRLAAVVALRKAGFHVIEAEDGARGLELARACKPELIVCDVMMPVMNGYQFVTALRAEPEVSDIPVIMLTAMAERAHMRVGMTSGADDYLAKPFRIQELCDAANALINRRQTQRQQIVGALKARFATALDEQKEDLARQYELRMLKELNDKWSRTDDANSEQSFKGATLLLVDLFATIAARGGTHEEVTRTVRRCYQSARDILYLFGAVHLQPFGTDLLAVFSPDHTGTGVSPQARAIRAAFGLSKMLSTPSDSNRMGEPESTHARACVALCKGDLSLLRVSDALHGDPDSILTVGTGLAVVQTVLGAGRAEGWAVGCTEELAANLPEPVTRGRTLRSALPGLRETLNLIELQDAN